MASGPPNIDNLSPLAQLAVLVIGAVASALAWLAGQRNKPPPSQNGNHLALEIETLRRDLERVLYAHREAIDVKIVLQVKEIRDMIERGATEARDERHEITERLRSVEISTAELRARERRDR